MTSPLSVALDPHLHRIDRPKLRAEDQVVPSWSICAERRRQGLANREEASIHIYVSWRPIRLDLGG